MRRTRKVPPNLGKVKAFQPKHRIAVTSAFLDLDTGISKQLDRSCLRLGRLGDSDDVELEFPIAAFTRTRVGFGVAFFWRLGLDITS